jgi:hypothetical protein
LQSRKRTIRERKTLWDFPIGDFTATLWGFAPYPLNVSGAFSLMRLEEVQLVPEESYKIYLPLVMR